MTKHTYYCLQRTLIHSFSGFWTQERCVMKDGVTLDSLHLTSKPELSVCASASLIIDISQPKKCSVNEAKKSMIACDEEVKEIKKSRKVACDEEVKEIKKSRKVACDEEVKQIKKSRKVACDEEVKQIKKSRKVRTQGLSNLRPQWLDVGMLYCMKNTDAFLRVTRSGWMML